MNEKKKQSPHSFWKNSALSSGGPFEFETYRFFDNQGADCFIDSQYDRFDEEGDSKQFSFDVLADFNHQESNILTEFLVECKYVHQSRDWLMIPWTKHDMYRNLHHCFLFDDLGSDNIFDPDVSLNYRNNNLFNNVPVCAKGIEIGETGNREYNESQLTKAIYQIGYGSIAKAFEEYQSKIFGLGDFNRKLMRVPVILTTAKLKVLKPDVTLKQFLASNNDQELTNELPMVAVNNVGHMEQTSYAARMATMFSAEFQLSRGSLGQRLDKAVQVLDTLNKTDRLGQYIIPSNILVVHYDIDDESHQNLKVLVDYFYHLTMKQMKFDRAK